ncbi:MAG: hypothetical protein ACLGJB_18330 [Blastocatellia bacterium]
MEKEDNLPAHEKRHLQVYADDEDILVRVLDIPEADYECVMVNSSWPEKSLLEGDIILFAARADAAAGDVVLIQEEESRVRLGILSKPGFLETTYGRRPLEASERIIGVGVALARRLRGASESRPVDADAAGGPPAT